MNEIKISIIIATRHRDQILWETVDKACKVIENKNAEIIIVNDGDSPLNIPVSIVSQISYYDNPKKGVSSARNFGASKAKGEILFFVDDDMWINNEVINWTNSYVIDKSNTGAVYFINWEYPPYLKSKLTQSKIGRYLLSTHYYTLWGRLHKNESQPVSGFYQYDSLGSGSLVMHKKIFNNAGGYNEKMIFQGEDADLAGRFNKAAVPIYIVFDITLYHNHSDRLEMNNFLKRIYDGFGSEFKAIKAGVIIPMKKTNYKGFQKLIFEFSRYTEKVWISLFNILPNHALLSPFNNRLIGALGGLQRYKQWRAIMN
ncbi:MAG TPA: glycosyltransferase family 2 protein [Ginsengibacter sp.]